MNYGMIHFGPYEGCTIEDIVICDPAWVIENAKQHQIPRDAVHDARVNLDQYDEYEEGFPSIHD